jgi:hypothetical protein
MLESIDPEAIMKRKARELEYLDGHIAWHKASVIEFEAKRTALINGSGSRPSLVWDRASKV